jgi:RHS repeat-associated protein
MITIQSGDNISVQSVATAANATLSVTGGLLTVTLGSTTLSGPLSMTGGALVATGAGVSAVANGVTSVADANLTASSGANLSLPQLTTYSANVNALLATGANSVLDVSNLAAVAQGGRLDLFAVNGGTLKLTSLTRLSTNLDNYNVTDSGGGVLFDPNLTTLNGVSVTLDGTDAQVASSWTALTGGSLTVTAGSYNLPGLTDVDGSNLTTQSGGSLSLPQLTSYSPKVNALLASGANSVLDLSNLATVTQNSRLDLFAVNGGTLKLNGLTSLSTTADNYYITDTGGGTLLDPNLITLKGVNITLDGTDGQASGAWTTLTGGSLIVTGGSYNLPGLTDVDGSNLTAQGGGSLSLPGVKAYESIVSTFLATGANSVLDLSNLTSVTHQGSWTAFVQNGAALKLNSLASLNTDLDNFYIFDTGGGELLDPSLTTLNGVNFTTDGTDAQFASAWTSFTDGAITQTGGSFTLPNLTNLDGTTVLVQASASLTLSGLKSYSSVFVGNGSFLAALGTGSMLNLPALTTLTQPGAIIPEVYAQNGGAALLPVLQQGNVTLASSMAATIDGTLVSVPADKTDGATVTIPGVSGVTVTLQNSGTLTDTTIIVGANGTVLLSGGTYLGNTTFHVDSGATASLTGGAGLSTNYAGTLSGTGAGGVQLSAGGFITAGGTTLNFPGTIFQWIGGNFFAGLGDVTNLGTINLVGPGDKGFFEDATLDNFGVINQVGAGNLDLHSDNVAPTTLKIEPSASYLISSDSGFDNTFGGIVAVVNEGTLAKTAGTGTSQLLINGSLTNTGRIEVHSGTLFLDANNITQVSGTVLTGGVWNALDGATLQFAAGTNITTNNAALALDGAGAAIDGIDNLAANGGSFSLTNGATFTTAADFLNSGVLTVGAGSTLAVTGAFTQTSAGTLTIQIGGTPASALFGQVAVTKTATLAGAFDLALVNGFTPTGGQSFGVMSFASASGNFASFSGLSPDFTEALTAHSLELTAGGATVDLATGNVTAPTTVAAGGQITVHWTVTNQSNTAVSGTWQDSVYLSTTPSITATSILLGSVPHSGGLAANGSYAGAFTGAIPGAAPGEYFILVQADSLFKTPDANRSNNIASAGSGPLQISATVLTLNTPLNDAFTAADQNRYYQLTVPAGGSVSITLASAAASGSVALYVRQGTLPTPYSYQEAAAVNNQPTQTLAIPQVLATGTYYVLAHSISGNAADAGFTLTATQSSALAVSSISSYAGGNAGNVTIEIDGANFSPAATASLTLGGVAIVATTVDFVNAGQLFATFNLAGATPGSYGVEVQQGAPSATAPSAFQVTATATQAPLGVALTTPQFIRSGRTGTIVVSYKNTTSNDLVAPLLQIASTNTSVFFSTPDNPNNFTQSALVLAVASAGPAGILRPGQGGQLTLTLLSNDPINNDSVPVQVAQVEAGQQLNLAAQQPVLKPSNISTAAWNVIFGNVMALVGSTTDSYDAALAQAATYLNSIGESAAEVSSVTRLYSFLVSQANASFPAPTLTSAVDAELSTPGHLSLTISRTFVSTLSGRYQQGIFGLGWTTPWQTSLNTDSSGNVTISYNGSNGFFVHQANGSYLNIDGEYGALTSSGGVFTFTSIDGTQYRFLPNGRLNYIQDANGNRIAMGYNALNQLVTLTYSNPSDAAEPAEQLTLTYNAQGFVAQESDGGGGVWSFVYDSAGHLISVTAPGNLTTSYTYDASGNGERTNALLSIAYPNGLEQNFTYDSLGRLAGGSQNGGANAFNVRYDHEAEITTTDSASNQTTVWFNDLGMASRVVDPRGAVSNLLYDVNGNLTEYTDALGNTYQGAYDLNGNLTQIINPLGQTLSLTYGPLSKLTSITDALGNTTRYSSDAAGNLLSISYPDGTHQSFSYDPLGNLTETVLQNGDLIAYESNPQGLITKRTFADGTSQTYTYDAHGNLLTASSFDSTGTLTGTTTLTYNAANELLSVTYPNGQFLHLSYVNGLRSQSIDQDGFTISYSYDALGRLSALKDGAGSLIVQYSYDNLGRLVKKVNGNGTSTTYAYDATGNLTNEVNFAQGTTINSSFTYTYNLLGEQTSVTDEAGAATLYSYDATGQLTQMTLPGGATIRYVYNPAGDRTAVIDVGQTTSYASNNDNEITQVGSATYTYDANGNLHTITDPNGTTIYTFNELNQLTSIAAPDGSLTSFQYSPLGYLAGTSVTTNGATSQTNYLVDPTGIGTVVGSYNGAGALIAHFVQGLGLVSQTGPGGTGYYDFDASGNTAGITGSTGAYVNQYSYLPFGETTTVSAALPNPFTFAGRFGVMQIDANLFSMRARNYAPATGQFLSNDPIGLRGEDSNVRRYVGNDPIAFVDPTGLSNGKPIFIVPKGDPEAEPIKSPVVEPDTPPPLQDKPENDQPVEGQTNDPNGPPSSQTPWAKDPQGFLNPVLTPTSNGPSPNPVIAAGGVIITGGIIIELLPIEIPGVIIGGALVLNGCTNVTSHDPNAMIGPAGFGTPNFTQPQGGWSYTVDFENDASAAAQDVTVTEQLDAHLDWSTFQLGAFGFGSLNVPVPAGLTQYQITIHYHNTDGTALNVLVRLDFNVQTGLLTADYSSVDPTNGQAPSGVFDGFLPPDDNSQVGEGFVQYTVKPNAGLANGTKINAQSSIVFDTNPSLATNNITNTLLTDANGIYVATVFQNVLGRLPDDAGFAYWTGQLDGGAPRTPLINSIDHSAEYYTTIVIPAYQKFLGRAPDAGGLAYWVAQMQNGLSDERLEAGFIGSSEYYVHSGGTNKAWVDNMYLNLLGRAPDAGGEAYWIGQLAEGADRATVAFGFAASQERESEHIFVNYEKYLGRTPDAAGLSFWLDQFVNHGKSNEDLITGFVASDEYFREHSGQ